MHKRIYALISIPFLLSPLSTFAANTLSLNHLPVSTLSPYFAKNQGLLPNKDQLVEINRNIDMNHTTHIRVQQTYDGAPVFGAQAILHVPASLRPTKNLSLLATQSNNTTTMNGDLFKNLGDDLAKIGVNTASPKQSQKAELAVEALIKNKYPTAHNMQLKQSQRLVYIDKNQQARFAYLIAYSLREKGKMPAAPTYIVDAETFAVYEAWNNMQSISHTDGGGLGGNTAHHLVYDGLGSDLAKLDIERDDQKNLCYLLNDDATVYDFRKVGDFSKLDKYRGKLKAVAQFSCQKPDDNHNHLYWDNQFDKANGGYSPSNDSIYDGAVIQEMYKQWYGVPMLKNQDGSPMQLELLTHSTDPFGDMVSKTQEGWENAVWDPSRNMIYLGDGGHYFYPLTSLGVVAHEVSHGFTQQHSDLVYTRQSGGMNESFSDMAAQAAEVFSTEKPSWQIGAEIMKQEGTALRYMDQPSKDCDGREPGDECSIDHVRDYFDGLDVHFTSGIYNRMFYLLASSDGWDVKKAFGLMLQANANYWTSNATYAQAACGVLSAAKDLSYDDKAIKRAFDEVGVKYKNC